MEIVSKLNKEINAGLADPKIQRFAALTLAPSPFLHIGETDCVAGVIGLELRCAERRFISLKRRAVLDSCASAETAGVPRENDLLRWGWTIF
jgi:hypothetical protein